MADQIQSARGAVLARHLPAAMVQGTDSTGALDAWLTAFEWFFLGSTEIGSDAKVGLGDRIDGVTRLIYPSSIEDLPPSGDPNSDTNRTPIPTKRWPFDLGTTDLMTWLSEWVALTGHASWTDASRLRALQNAVQSYRYRGTRKGLLMSVQGYLDTLNLKKPPVIRLEPPFVEPEPPPTDSPTPFHYVLTIPVEGEEESVVITIENNVRALITQIVPAHVYCKVKCSWDVP